MFYPPHLSFPFPVPALKLKLSNFSTSPRPQKQHMNTSSLWPGQSPQRLELTSVFTMGILLIYTALIWEEFGTFCYAYSGWVTYNELKGQVSLCSSKSVWLTFFWGRQNNVFWNSVGSKITILMFCAWTKKKKQFFQNIFFYVPRQKGSRTNLRVRKWQNFPFWESLAFRCLINPVNTQKTLC